MHKKIYENNFDNDEKIDELVNGNTSLGNIIRMKRNIIWFLVDGVRNYPCPDDPMKMGKPEIFDEMANDGIEFSTTISSGTSTSMSLISYLTGIPSYSLGNNYQDFFTDEFTPPNLTGILREYGYRVNSICIGADFRRDRWKRDLPHVPKKYWPKGSYRMSYWPNNVLPVVLDNLLQDGLKEPFLVYMHFNGRRDADISKKIRYCLKLFKENKLYEESLIIMCSDHGMPDNSRRDYTAWLREQGISHRRHDLIVTDDNILVPLVLRFPGCPKGVKIKEPVGTIDLFPTILDLLDLKYGEFSEDIRNFHGTSLLPLIWSDSHDSKQLKWFSNRKFRTDSRFMGQTGRITSIRGSRYKYVFTYDVEASKQKQFYDLAEDPMEEENIIESTDPTVIVKIAEFANELKRSNEAFVTYYLSTRQAKLAKYLAQYFNKQADNSNRVFLLIGSCNINFAYAVSSLLRKIYPDIAIDLLLERSNPHKREELNKLGFRNNIYHSGEKFNAKAFKSTDLDYIGTGALLEHYDLILVPFTNYYHDMLQNIPKHNLNEVQINIPEAEVGALERLDFNLIKNYREIFKIVKSIPCKRKIFFDTNFHFYSHPKFAVYRTNMEKAFSKRDIYLSQPINFFRDLIAFIGFK